MSRLLPVLVFALLTVLPARAQDAAATEEPQAEVVGSEGEGVAAGEVPAPDNIPGPVEQFILGHRLFAAGAASNDGLTQVAAARLLAGFTLIPSGLISESEGKDPETDTTPPPEAGQLLDQAIAAVEADEALGILLTTTIANAEFLPKASIRRSVGGLGAGQIHRYRIPADGGVALDMGVVSLAPQALDLNVATEAGLLCQGVSYCRIVLPESGFVTVTLRNPSATPAAYWLLNN